jgi:hypothetical protein
VTDIEQLLLAKALEDANSGPSMVQMGGGGALAGTTLGVLQGASLPSSETNAPSTETAEERDVRRGRNFRKRRRRMAAGSLIGAALGGGLGAGTKAMFLSGMPNQAADMLSKMQTSPEGLSEADRLQLRAILRQIYSGQ